MKLDIVLLMRSIMQNNKTHPICIRISEKLWKQYQLRYPHTFSTFVRRSLSKALTSREFFDSVYFFNFEVK